MLDKLCLTQDDFDKNIITKFTNLRTEALFFDVTLVCEDQMQIMAHKIALSSCSEKFTDNHSPFPGTRIEVSSETSVEEINKIIAESIIKIGKGTYKCKVCGLMQKKAKHLPEHIESHHIYGVSYSCEECDKKYKTRDSLRGHKRKFHTQQMRDCPIKSKDTF